MSVDQVVNAFGVTFALIYIQSLLASSSVASAAKRCREGGVAWIIAPIFLACGAIAYGVGALWGYGVFLVIGGPLCQ